MKVPRGKALAGALVLTSAGIGFTGFLLLAPEAPVSISLSNPADQTPAAVRSETLDPVGTWQIVPASEVRYRVREKLARLPSPSEAIGRTTAVSGQFVLSGTRGEYAVSDIVVEVDMRQLASDSPRRDEALRSKGLETDRFPLAGFVSHGPLPITEDPFPGAPVEFTLEGALTVHGVTRQVSIPVRAQLTADQIEVIGSLTLPMANFGIEPPRIANMVTVEPIGVMEFHLWLEKAG